MTYKLLYCAILLSGILVIRHQYVDYRVIRFNEYLRKFNKSYGEEEFHRRMLYFEGAKAPINMNNFSMEPTLNAKKNSCFIHFSQESLEEIKRLNYGELSTGAVYGLTKYSDWHKDEFKKVMLLEGRHCVNYAIKNCNFSGSANIPNQSSKKLQLLPDKLDWRNVDGVIGPVENQKQCNGCWAFGIVGVMEAMSAIDKIGYESLSIQQLLDCSKVNHQCDGGNIDTALKNLCFHDIKLTTEDNYPQILVNEKCRNTNKPVRGIKNFQIICNFDDYIIMDRLVHGPVLVVVKPNGWLNYVGGIITRNCFDDGHGFSHVVQIVGYDTATDEENNQIPFFIIKNSYGTDWGEHGYIRVARSKQKNLCGLYDHMAWLDVKK